MRDEAKERAPGSLLPQERAGGGAVGRWEVSIESTYSITTPVSPSVGAALDPAALCAGDTGLAWVRSRSVRSQRAALPAAAISAPRTIAAAGTPAADTQPRRSATELGGELGAARVGGGWAPLTQEELPASAAHGADRVVLPVPVSGLPGGLAACWPQ